MRPHGDPLDFDTASAAVMEGLFGPTAGRPQVGRYTLLRRIGEGAMGRVYLGHDPELDREVAIKVIRSPDPSLVRRASQRARLLREAQALAQVSHPNVVEIFEVGIRHGDIFMAMELVRGISLRQWSSTAEKTWSAKLDVLLQAARGLSAAHDAGVVHRDVKPDNVIVGEDGRIRVVDFGLARVGAEADEGVPSEVGASGTDPGSPSITRTGAVIGSPAYMAPEQLAGAPGSESADQFSFCVSAFEVLHGVRPFPGETRAVLLASAVAGRFVTVRDDVPSRLDAAIRRGLSADPTARWPSLRALIAELSRAPAIRPRGVIAGVTIGAGALLALMIGARSEPQAPCDVEPVAVWSDDLRDRVRERLGVDAIATPIIDALDEYAAALDDARAQACVATDATPVEVRLACLTRGRDAFAATVEVLAGVDRRAVGHAPEMVEALPDPQRCVTADAGRLGPRPPRDETTAREVARIRAGLARPRALTLAGRYDQSLAAAQRLLPDALAVEYPIVAAEVRMVMADVLLHLNRAEASAEQSRRAYFVAQAEGHDELAIKVALMGCAAHGYALEDVETGEEWCGHARAIASRLGDPPRWIARVDGHLGMVRLIAGDADAAVELISAAIEAHPNDRPLWLARQRADLGTALRSAGRPGEARVELEASRQAMAGHLGPDHPRVGSVWRSLGNSYAMAGKWDEARRAFGEALRISDALDPESADAALARASLGNVAISVQDYATGRALLAGALEVFESIEGPQGPRAMMTIGNLAAAEMRLGAHERAASLLRRKLATQLVRHGEEHPEVGFTYQIIGDNEHARGELEASESAYRRALEIFEVRLGADHVDLGYPLVGLGAVMLEQGRADEALVVYRRAVQVRDIPDGDSQALAEAREGVERSLKAAASSPRPRGGSPADAAPSPQGR